jgi:hypothetical protein
MGLDDVAHDVAGDVDAGGLLDSLEARTRVDLEQERATLGFEQIDTGDVQAE